MTDRIELGCPGHFICAKDCRWRRHTQVNQYRISTVGNLYYPDGKRRTLGCDEDSWFETMVFTTSDEPAGESDGCGCLTVLDWAEVDSATYKTPGEAQAGHERFVKKYMDAPTFQTETLKFVGKYVEDTPKTFCRDDPSSLAR